MGRRRVRRHGTTWILGAILIARKYGTSPSVSRRLALFACGVTGLLSKETAAVLPFLIMADMWATSRRSRALVIDACVLLAFAATVGVVRLASAPQMMKQPVTKFMMQRWLFGTFGSGALPWHSIVMQRLRWVVLVEALACIGLLTAFFLRGATGRTRASIAMAGWMLLGTLPVITIHGVAPDLQAARYLYLPSMGWAGLLACFASTDGGADRARHAIAIGASLILATYVVGLQMHVTPWQRAGEARDRLERAAMQDRRMAACQRIQLADLPDNVDGAYVLRNGGAEAFGRDLGIQVSADATAECAFAWDEQHGRFGPATRSALSPGP